MKLSKRLTSLIMIPVLVLTITFCDVKKTEAAEIVGGVVGVLGLLVASTDLALNAIGGETYQNWYDSNIDKIRQSCSELLQRVGLPHKVADMMSYLNSDPLQEFRRWMARHTDRPENEITDDEVKQAIYNMYKNCHVGDNNFEMSSDLTNYIDFLGKEYIDANKYYVGYSSINSYTFEGIS